MPIDTKEPESPGWWLDRLLARLIEKREQYDLLESYYDNTNVIPISATKGISDAYRRLMEVSKTNFAELVVEAVRERMLPVGFRTGVAGDRTGDAAAWDIWQANSLDSDCSLIHAPSLTMGMGYAIVGPVDPEIEAPLITPEDPREVIVETDPRRRRKVVAGLKAYRDDVRQEDVAYLYLQGEMRRAVRASTSIDGGTMVTDSMASGWQWDQAWTMPGPVPVVPFPNRPKIGNQMTRGEYETHLSILNRINYTILQRVEVATLQAFRQRAIKGDLPTTDEDGNDIDYNDVFESSPGALWQLPETVDIWESGQVDLGPIRQAIRDDVQDLAAVTRTPLFYLTPEATNGSAEGAALAREGLIFKTRDRIVEASEAWEQVMSLAFRFADDEERANRKAMEVIWAPPERFSLNEKADAASKAMAGGMTWRKTMEEIWQFTPQEIGEMEAERRADMIRERAAATVGQVMGGQGPASESEAV